MRTDLDWHAPLWRVRGLLSWSVRAARAGLVLCLGCQGIAVLDDVGATSAHSGTAGGSPGCSSRADCASGRCEAGACVETKPDGAPCTSASECQSAHCSTGVCCESSCAGPCEACAQFATGHADGTCASGLAGTDQSGSCPLGQLCDGKGQCSSVHLWSKRFGGLGPDGAFGVASDAAGNVLLTGTFGDAIDFGAGPVDPEGDMDVFVLKLDPDGNHLWSRHAGGGPASPGFAFYLATGYSVAADSAGDVLVAGQFSGSIDLGGGKLESAGELDIDAFDAAGAVLLLCDFGGITFLDGAQLESTGEADVFALKLDPDGKLLWSKRFGGPDNDRSGSIAADAAGNVVLTGWFSDSIDLGDGKLESAGKSDVFAAKLDPDGKLLWSERFGGPGFDGGTALALDDAGNVLLAGSFEDTIDLGGGKIESAGQDGAFVVKLDLDGKYLWSRRFGGSGSDGFNSVAVNAAGDLLLSGCYQGAANYGGAALVSVGKWDVVLLGLDPSGDHRWSRSLGGSAPDTGGAPDDLAFVATDPAGSLLLAGSFEEKAIDLGAGPVQSAGDGDIFVLKYAP
ncbi:MAG: hypothetical protein HY744_19090 [Deltaproteobacteria bacterium]|nr:hypothetical protein [Deltaproteobacteria bacterium]